MARFGLIATIDTLAGGDILRWDVVGEKQIGAVLLKLELDAERDAYQSRFANAVRNKNKKR